MRSPYPNIINHTQARQNGVIKAFHTPPNPPATTFHSDPSAEISAVAVTSTPKYREPSSQSWNQIAPEVAKGPAPPDTVTECIDSPMEFPTTWYTHPRASEFYICSKCHYDFICGTRLESELRGERTNDRKPRVCRFSKPRVKDFLWPLALSEGSFEQVLAYMQRRPSISDCKGTVGAKGTEGINWFSPIQNCVPGMVICEACYEDSVAFTRFASKFEKKEEQGPNDTWACDLPLHYIYTELKKRSKVDDWPGFVTETNARMKMPACPKWGPVGVATRKWFTPTFGSYEQGGVLICVACYCDYVLNTDQTQYWKDAGDGLGQRFGEVRCATGQFNVSIAMGRAQGCKDFSIFWNAIEKGNREEYCNANGIKDGKWFTFRSNPANFGICGGCFAIILEPLGLAHHFVPKAGVSKGEVLLCCLNPKSPRFISYTKNLLEAFFTRNVAAYEKYAVEFANLPICKRDEDFKGGVWYGWEQCHICPECYHEFVKGTALDASMTYRGVLLKDESCMCEMYSPRMRALYQEACTKSPPDASELLAYSDQRRIVYINTVMQIRRMLIESRLMLGQQQLLNANSLFYNNMGRLQEITMPSAYAYGAAGIGYGYANQSLLQGAMYGQQAMGVMQQATNPSRTLLVGQLERQWRAVE
ncbi:hypothetical protein jhhlp_008830 [Lomentospora prolificans]|uniref:Integral membrane protein n=1 Tax=Lomentospora prolificans TaxID=41688 RepID=A0A2N3MZ43_9PEZI|nr:hypothetical protein jhhlp_008830 [Lomentospora prolificans]